MQKGSTVRGRASNLLLFFFRVCCQEPFDTTQDLRSPCCEAHPTDGTEKRFALRLTLADCNCQCTAVLYHELVLRAAASMDCVLSDTVHDTDGVEPIRGYDCVFARGEKLFRTMF